MSAPRPWYVVTVAYQRVEASSAAAAAALVANASGPRRGVGRDLVVTSLREAEALLDGVGRGAHVVMPRPGRIAAS
jgi:hypothetical protein